MSRLLYSSYYLLSASLHLHSPTAIFESPMPKRSAFSGDGLFDRMLPNVSFAVS